MVNLNEYSTSDLMAEIAKRTTRDDLQRVADQMEAEELYELYSKYIRPEKIIREIKIPDTPFSVSVGFSADEETGDLEIFEISLSYKAYPDRTPDVARQIWDYACNCMYDKNFTKACLRNDGPLNKVLAYCQLQLEHDRIQIDRYFDLLSTVSNKREVAMSIIESEMERGEFLA
jgi:hypothetical protein